MSLLFSYENTLARDVKPRYCTYFIYRTLSGDKDFLPLYAGRKSVKINSKEVSYHAFEKHKMGGGVEEKIGFVAGKQGLP